MPAFPPFNLHCTGSSLSATFPLPLCPLFLFQSREWKEKRWVRWLDRYGHPPSICCPSDSFVDGPLELQVTGGNWGKVLFWAPIACLAYSSDGALRHYHGPRCWGFEQSACLAGPSDGNEPITLILPNIICVVSEPLHYLKCFFSSKIAVLVIFFFSGSLSFLIYCFKPQQNFPVLPKDPTFTYFPSLVLFYWFILVLPV